VAIVVSDTSPIRALHHLALLDLLKDVYGKVYLPDAVAEELRNPSLRFGSFNATAFAFLVIESPLDLERVAVFQKRLDAGEAAALALALERNADYVLLDERAGRRIAQELGFNVIGVLGVLSEARRRGLVPLIAPLILRLQSEMSFHLAPPLVAEVLRLAGE
jgi:predicted nucleic acid-binding protein